jgi:serralysin
VVVAAADGGDSGNPARTPAGSTDVVETSDAANGTGTTYSISVGQSASGSIASLGDSDWYRIDLVAGHTYTFAVAGLDATSSSLDDPDLYLRNSAGTQLAYDDFSGPGWYPTITYTATTTGTYYLDVRAFNNASTGNYGVSAIEATRASYDLAMGAGALLVPNLSWSGSPVTSATVTYGFRQTTNGNAPNFSQLSAVQIAAVEVALQFWSDVANITFTRVNSGGYTDSATMLFANYFSTTDGAGAYAYYPGSKSSTANAGDVWLNTNSVSTTSLPFGSYSFFAILHEIGHAIGLSHPGDYNAAPGVSITYATHAQFSQDTQQYTVMSYFDEANTGAQFFNGYGETPMLFDVYALQRLYGAKATTRSGDTTYGNGSNAGSSVYDFSSNTTPAFTIWDGGGTDTLNSSGYSSAQIINLNAGSFSSIRGGTNNIVIASGVTIENAVGGSGNDTITGNSADNTLTGNAGNDSLTGGSGLDTFNGGSGTDTFVFNSAALTSLTASAYHRITDYDQGNSGSYNSGEGDKIDLSAVLATAYGSGQSVSALVRAIMDSSNTFALLQIDTNGAVGGANWATVARLDGLHVGDAINVIVDPSQPAGATINVAASTALKILNPAVFGVAGNGQMMTVGILMANLGVSLSIAGLADASKFQINGNKLEFITPPSFSNPTDSDHNNSYIVQVTYSNGAQSDIANLTINVTDPAKVAPHDLDGNGKSDILWRTDDGQAFSWALDSFAFTQGSLGGQSTAWQHNVATADFNGDGRSDILWRHDDGRIGMWIMCGADGIEVLEAREVGFSAPAWHIVGTGDLNCDGKADIVFRHEDGRIGTYLMNGTQVTFAGEIGRSSPSWHIAGIGDFNGDGKDDIVFHHDDGRIGMFLMNGAQVTFAGEAGAASSSWTLAGTGDFNGDGKDDIVWRTPDGAVEIWLMNGASVMSTGHAGNSSLSWHIEGTADINGDGKSDILFRHDDGRVGAYLMNGTATMGSGEIGTAPTTWHMASNHFDFV